MNSPQLTALDRRMLTPILNHVRRSSHCIFGARSNVAGEATNNDQRSLTKRTRGGNETKTREEEERRCAFLDVRADTAHTADRNVTLSREVPDDSKEPREYVPFL
ncbi:uncharacterized protein LOC143152129 isoform X1 [Ptiloglossa arizonensis]|uniref:uncharacterized protein LOC143152129 isoform X1 n=1 Tax=Ptiloglossa arizonensis TaxID=3350558 RepID=UPI003FA032C1